MQYLARWPEYCHISVAPGCENMAYILGKAEGTGKNWHGHVTAVTVSPTYRRQRLAKKLMDLLEEVTIHMYVLFIYRLNCDLN